MSAVRLHTFVLAAVLALMAGVAEAQRQPNPQQPPRGRAAANGGLSPAEILNMLDAYAIVQAQETLQLADNQYGEFVARLKRLQQTRRRNLQARNGILQELRRLAGPQAAQIDETAVRERLKALNDHDDRAAHELRQAYQSLDEILDARQQARFRLFEELLERRKIDLLKRAQQGAARPRRE
ncbi:MAG TPA: hypothetical protein VJ813_08840 [Vicinamibacterales bacterium]|nr:hypothetical protein [Vicinamibacterales bacterium]